MILSSTAPASGTTLAQSSQLGVVPTAALALELYRAYRPVGPLAGSGPEGVGPDGDVPHRARAALPLHLDPLRLTEIEGFQLLDRLRGGPPRL
eukprot:CAMPEP_0202847094 /NCGR_PEP_ID=MMETSP1389-20130828/74580_1 /ASSEMBLY_ACC=CAM_ASM_000865 /TAXON_ID=302021 /ORGANISM="Rhodomonas sp., Strain CCMP768" /LENGTH=92 /DNA_ID=CAMNT_0049524753 /DNA_START=218 /DNA_END=494 /DNA_ORIENTATION=+